MEGRSGFFRPIDSGDVLSRIGIEVRPPPSCPRADDDGIDAEARTSPCACALAGLGVLRRDACQNLRAIISAAGEMYSQDSFDVPMDAIAQRAGVGVATLYRRFPDRASLDRALHHERLGWVEAVLFHAEKLVEADPVAAFDQFFRTIACTDASLLLSFGLESRAKGERIDDVIVARCLQVIARSDSILAKAQGAGGIRADVTTFDVAVLSTSIARPLRGVSAAEHALIRERHIDLILAGMHTDRVPTRALALTFEDLEIF